MSVEGITLNITRVYRFPTYYRLEIDTALGIRLYLIPHLHPQGRLFLERPKVVAPI
jgi:hypothetical protein